MAEEKKVGVVESYFGKVGVAAMKITDETLRVGDTIRVKGHTTDVLTKVESIQIEHAPVQEAGPGASVGIKIAAKVREHDVVYKVLP